MSPLLLAQCKPLYPTSRRLNVPWGKIKQAQGIGFKELSALVWVYKKTNTLIQAAGLISLFLSSEKKDVCVCVPKSPVREKNLRWYKSSLSIPAMSQLSVCFLGSDGLHILWTNVLCAYEWLSKNCVITFLIFVSLLIVWCYQMLSVCWSISCLMIITECYDFFAFVNAISYL